MGFFADLKMAFNPSTQTKDYAARTAQTMANQQGKSVSDSREAQNYMKKKGVTLDDRNDMTLLSAKSSPSKKSSPTDNIVKSLRPKTRPKNFISVPGEGNVEVPQRNPFVGSLSAAEASVKKKFAPTITNKAAPNQPVKQKRGNKKPNALGYGYYNKQNVWIPPDIDIQDGGGPGISGAVFGSRGGLEADAYPYGNGDGYVTKKEAEAAAEAGKFKYGIGSLSNAVGATPFGSGEAPTGIAGVVARGGALGSLMGNEYEPRGRMFGPDGVSMTQEQVDKYMKEVQQRRNQAAIDQQQLILHGSPSDDRPASTEVVGKEPDDPCPEGYMMDPTTNQCVMDPFKTPFPDTVTGGSMPVASGVSPYTQVANMTLGQLNPTVTANVNPLAMQQANMPPQGGLGSLSPVTSRTS